MRTSVRIVMLTAACAAILAVNLAAGGLGGSRILAADAAIAGVWVLGMTTISAQTRARSLEQRIARLWEERTELSRQNVELKTELARQVSRDQV